MGELWLDGRPRALLGAPAARATRRPEPSVSPLAGASRRRSSRASPTTSPTSSSTSTTGFYGACARALRAVPRGEVVTYGELAALAGRPGAARAAGTFCARNRLAPFVPCHRVVAASGIGSFGVARDRRTSGACWRSRMSLSDELRDELASIAPARRCCRSPSSRRSATPQVPGTCTATASSRSTSTSRAPAAARRAFALLRDLGVRSEIRTYPRRAFDRATRYQLHVEVDDGPPRCSREAGRALGARRAARASRRSASSDAPAAAAPTCAGRCSAPARCRARARRTSSCAPRTREGARLLAEIAATRGRRAEGRRAPAPRGRLREGGRDDRRPARARRRERDGAAPRRARRRRRHPLPRRTGSRTPTRRTSSARSTPPSAQLEAIRQLDLDALPPKLQEIAALRLHHPRALAYRARGASAGRRSPRRRRTTG